MKDQPDPSSADFDCPACALALPFQAWQGADPSDEICPQCGIQFGYDDVADGDLKRRATIYSQWRDRWIAPGRPMLFPRAPE